MSLAKKPGRWDCIYPLASVGYGFRTLRFPRCLPFWWRRHQLWIVVIHTLGHLFKLDWGKANEKLLRLGLLYCATDGGILTWQWRFWRGSPLAKAMKEG